MYILPGMVHNGVPGSGMVPGSRYISHVQQTTANKVPGTRYPLVPHVVPGILLAYDL